MIFFQNELMQNLELAKDMKLGLYVSGFWHVNSNNLSVIVDILTESAE